MEKQEPVIRNLCGCLNKDGVLIYTFGDVIENNEDYSFMDDSGNQAGELENDIFGYGSIGISENLRVINDAQCKCMHLELDQYPEVHVYVILKKE